MFLSLNKRRLVKLSIILVLYQTYYKILLGFFLYYTTHIESATEAKSSVFFFSFEDITTGRDR